MTLQEEIGQLDQCDPKNFYGTTVTPAALFCDSKVYQHSGETLGTNSGDQLFNQLKKTTLDSNVRQILEVLDKWRGQNAGKVWISDTLPADMNLPLSKEECPEENTVQVFFVGQQLPTFVLTLFNEKSSHEKEEIHEYTVSTAQELNESLLDFCCDRFAILPCTLDFRHFNADSLQQELKVREEDCLDFYDGPIRLTTCLFKNISTAAMRLQGTSRIPNLLPFEPQTSDAEEKWLLDQHWRNVVHLLIECLTHADHRPVTITCKADWKMKVAMLEAALRVGRRDQVTIQSSDPTIRECVRKLKDRKANFTLEPQAMDKMDCIVVQVITKASKISFAMKGGIATVTVGTEERSVSMETDEVDKSCVGSSLEHEKVTEGAMEDTREDKESDHRRSKTNEITAHVHQPPAEDYTHACKIIGLPETEEDLQEKVLELFDNIMDLQIHRDELVSVQRTDITTGDEREVLVILKSQKARDEVVQHSWGLEKQYPGMFVEECLPPQEEFELQNARKNLGYYQTVRVQNGQIKIKQSILQQLLQNNSSEEINSEKRSVNKLKSIKFEWSESSFYIC